jgi:hypothetical protein
MVLIVILSSSGLVVGVALHRDRLMLPEIIENGL